MSGYSGVLSQSSASNQFIKIIFPLPAYRMIAIPSVSKKDAAVVVPMLFLSFVPSARLHHNYVIYHVTNITHRRR